MSVYDDIKIATIGMYSLGDRLAQSLPLEMMIFSAPRHYFDIGTLLLRPCDPEIRRRHPTPGNVLYVPCANSGTERGQMQFREIRGFRLLVVE